MRKIYQILIGCLAALLGSGSDSCAQMLTPARPSIEQLVVLKNGEVIRGKVTQTVDNVIIETESGSRLFMRQDRTDFICNTMDEAFWGKCARTKASDLDGQKQLFRWCLKHQLIDHAQGQLDLLMQTGINPADLEYLGRALDIANVQRQQSQKKSMKRQRLEVARNQSVESISDLNDSALNYSDLNSPAVASTFSATTTFEKSPFEDVDTTLFRPLPDFFEMESTVPANSGLALFPISEIDSIQSMVIPSPSVRQVGYTEDIPETPNHAEHQPNARPVTVAELVAEMKTLPKGAVGVFRKQIEQFMVKGCNAARCHDSSSHVMPVLDFPSSRVTPIRISQRNLHEVLKFVDFENPELSPVFVAATTSHAGAADPVFQQDSREYKNLIQWLTLISANPAGGFRSQRVEHHAPQRSTIDQNAKPLPGTRRSGFPNPVSPLPEKSNSLTRETSDGLPNGIPSTIGEIPEFDRNPSGYAPVDPFDPEIFNRKSGLN